VRGKENGALFSSPIHSSRRDGDGRKNDMAGNKQLGRAKEAKNDEFYTQFDDIEREVNAYLAFDPDVFRGKSLLLPCDDPKWSHFTRYFAQNFSSLGLKKLVSTGYAVERKRRLGLLPGFDPAGPLGEGDLHGRIFTLEGDADGNGAIDLDDLETGLLDGDGDFRSEEVKRLRDEADVIVTNPPFSLFREFLAWLTESGKRFLVVGSLNGAICKEVFPLFVRGKVWFGNGFAGGNAHFGIPEGGKSDYADGVFDGASRLVKFRNCAWFTNLDHGRRHKPLELMTWVDNVKYSRHKAIRGHGYRKYDGFDAIDVPYTDAIPGDFEGIMGVPVTFLEKHDPDQFEILGLDRYFEGNPNPGRRFTIDGKETYARILVRKRKGWNG